MGIMGDINQEAYNEDLSQGSGRQSRMYTSRNQNWI